MDVSNIIAISLSGIAIVFTGLTYCDNHRKTRIDIKAAKEAEKKRKKAQFHISAEYHRNGGLRVSIMNNGAHDAENFKYELNIENSTQNRFHFKPDISTLASMQTIECKGTLVLNHPDTLDVTLKWDDDVKKNNTLTKTIPIKF